MPLADRTMVSSTEAETTLTEARERVAQFQASVNSALSYLPQLAHGTCRTDRPSLTDALLELPIDTLEKAISRDALRETLQLDNAAQIVGLHLDPTSLRQDFIALGGIEIYEEVEQFIVKFPEGDIARAFDFLIEIEERDGVNCYVALRLHFAEKAPTLDEQGWSIVSAIGRSGMGRGRFSLPYGTQFYDGNLWTTDCSNENVSTFSLDGRFLDSFGSFGSRLGQLDTPAGMRIVDDRIYVVEERNHRVQVFNMSGAPIDVFGAFKATDDPLLYTDKFNNPLGIAYNGRHLAIVDAGNNRVVGIDPNSGYRTVWVSANMADDEPFDWEFPYYARWSEHGGFFVVSNRSANELVLIGPEGQKLRSLGADFLNYPHEVDIDTAGNIYVADTNNYRVVIYSSASDFDQSLAETIDFPESYGIPKTLTVLQGGRIAVGFVGNGSAYFLVLAPIDGATATTEQARLPVAPQEPIFAAVPGEDTAPVQTTSLEADARRIYGQFCSSCHENGDYNAPARGNIESWDRFSRDIDELLNLAIQGRGAMIARGGCDECTNEQLAATIEFMLPMTWFLNETTPGAATE